MADATCANCPWWVRSTEKKWGTDSEGEPEIIGEGPASYGRCHHASLVDSEGNPGEPTESWWCSEHPLRQRDQLAAMAFQGLLADPNCDPDPEAVASGAYSYADALLAERAKGATP